jgi:hypothetical protein
MKLLLSVLALSFLTTPALAEKPGKLACKAIKAQCRAVTGYVKENDSKGRKPEYTACLAAAYNGQPVSGVNVDEATLKACQAHKLEKAAKGENDEDGNPFN